MNRLKKGIACFALLALLGQGCTKGVSPEAKKLSEKKTLVIWSVIDDDLPYQKTMATLRSRYPYASISFKRFRIEEYESQLLNAFAEDRGPDIFMVHNTWIGKYQPKIQHQPAKVKVAEQVVTGTVKKETTLEVQESRTLTVTEMKKEFVDAVAGDVIRKVDVSTDPLKQDFQERIFAIPMSVDTLALYYNKDLLNAAGISNPPQTWAQFQDQVKKLALIDAQGGIIRAGAGFGTGANVERSPDIVSLLMMQNRTMMADETGYPQFSRIPQELSNEVSAPPAIDALRFYTDFANPEKEVYTWNLEQPNSLQAFTQGTSAFFLGYSYHLPTIRSQAPKLNIGITEVPQIENTPQVNYANYWAWTVSKKSKSTDLAWKIVNIMTSADQADTYLTSAKRPPARRSLIDARLDDADVGVFTSQVLTAKSWYHGVDPDTMEQVMMDMIDAVVRGEMELQKSINDAVGKVSQTIKRSTKQ
jgi:multiple sugar transport system substrate-binding protein